MFIKKNHSARFGTSGLLSGEARGGLLGPRHTALDL